MALTNPTTPWKVNLPDIFRGDSKTYKFTFTHLSVPVDITGWEFWLTIKSGPTADDTTAKIQKRVVAEVGADSTGGILYIDLDNTDTDISPGKYEYDVQRVIPGATDKVSTFMKGKVRVNADITRSTAV